MNKNDQQFMAQKIRTQYMEKEPSELDSLKELDKKLNALLFSLVMYSAQSLLLLWVRV